jgi:hypothetical protein
MSFGSNPNPFQQMGSARPKQPSIIPKIIAVVVVLFLLAAGLVFAAVYVKSISGGLAQGLYGSKEDAAKVTDVELWDRYNDDEEMAEKAFKGRWIVVTGECSEVGSFRPDGSAVNEQYSIQVGRRDRKFGEEWLIDCNIPRENVEAFNKRVKPNGTIAVRGKVVGRNSQNQVALKDCELVSFSIR